MMNYGETFAKAMKMADKLIETYNLNPAFYDIELIEVDGNTYTYEVTLKPVKKGKKGLVKHLTVEYEGE